MFGLRALWPLFGTLTLTLSTAAGAAPPEEPSATVEAAPETPPAEPAPETTAPETTAPETTAPETTAPETTAPETTATEPPPEGEPPPGGLPSEPEPEPGAEPEPEPELEPEPEPEPEPELELELATAVDDPAPAEEELAWEPPTRHKLVYKNLLALRYNPLGLVNEFTPGWRMQLFMKQGALWEQSYVGVKLHTFVSPAYTRLGPQIEIQPLAVLNLTATYDFAGFFSTFDQIQSFKTPTADYSDTALEKNGEDGDNYAITGHLVTLAALLQAKVKKIAVRDNLKAYYANFKLRDEGAVYYDQTIDILQPNEGWSLTNDLDLIYVLDFGLKLGARYTLTHAFYKSKHFLSGEPISEPNGPTHRVGPAILHTFYDKPERRFNKPTLIVLAQWWARHRYRTGADVSAGVPYIVVGFLFEGDLLPNPSKKKSRRKR